MLARLFKSLRLWLLKRKYRVGATLTEFIASDIRRDIEILDVSELEAGYVTARMRTWNVLYAIKGIAPKPDFDAPKRVAIDSLWKWNGPHWGGPVPDKSM